MAESCPNCGYCPTCKRANPPITSPTYLPVGYHCGGCGHWVYGAHVCWTVRPYVTTSNPSVQWRTTTTGATANALQFNPSKLVGGQQ